MAIMAGYLFTKYCFWMSLFSGGQKSVGSFYSIASGHIGGFIATGSTDCVVRIWDPRLPPNFNAKASSEMLVGAVAFTLPTVHTDVVRALHVFDETQQVTS